MVPTNTHLCIRPWDTAIILKRRKLRLRAEKSESQRQEEGQFIFLLLCVISKRISRFPVSEAFTWLIYQESWDGGHNPPGVGRQNMTVAEMRKGLTAVPACQWLAGMRVGVRVLPCQQGSSPPRTWPFLFQIIIANIP